MQGINLKTMIFVNAISTFNAAELKQSPPQGAIIEGSEDLIESALTVARRYDQYRKVLTISVHIPASGSVHYTLCGSAGVTLRQGLSIIRFGSASEVIQAFWKDMSMQPINAPIAGWRLDSFMPMLIAKGIQYDALVPETFKVDPAVTYSTPGPYLRLESIYQQGIRDQKYRPLPTFIDLCDWWGLPVKVLYISDDTLANFTDTEWDERGFAYLSAVLAAQEEMVRKYYGYKREI